MFRDVYYSQNFIRLIKSEGIRWVRHVARLGKKRNAYLVSVGWSEGNTPPGKSRLRWQVRISINAKEYYVGVS